MINLTAYDTSACKNFVLKEVVDALTKALIVNELKVEEHASIRSDLAFNYYIVTGGNPSSDNVKYFNHPLMIDDGSNNGRNLSKKVFVLDARSYGTWHKPSESFVIRNTSGYDFEVNRLILNQLWYKERPEILRDISHVPAQVYSTLISECVGKRFALDPREQSIVAILSSYFYCCLFTEMSSFEEDEYVKILSYVAKVSRLQYSVVEETLDFLNRTVIHDLEKLCGYIKEATESIALKDLNVGVLFALTTSTWFGNNAKETLAVGLEHIPTWLTIVYSSLEETTFKRSVLSKISIRFNKTSDSFIKSFKTIIEGKKPF